MIHGSTHFFCDGRRWRFFDQLLMISLYGAVTFSKCNYVSEIVCHDLNFHMARIFDIFFDVHCIIAKRICRFPLCHVEMKFKLVFGLCHAHTFSTAAGGCFDHYRITDLIRKFFTGFSIIDWFSCAGNDRYFGIHHGLAGMGFISHTVDDFCSRTDKCDTIFVAETDKICIFR